MMIARLFGVNVFLRRREHVLGRHRGKIRDHRVEVVVWQLVLDERFQSLGDLRDGLEFRWIAAL